MSAMQSHPIPRPSPLLRRREVEQLTGFKRSNIYKLMAMGAFPRAGQGLGRAPCDGVKPT